MISLIDELRNILKPNFICSKDSGSTIILEESQSQSSCKPITLNKKGVRTLTLQIDQGNFDAHPLLQNISGLHKHLDYLIFCENTDKTCYVLAIELKSKNPSSGSGWGSQVKAGLTIGQYLVGMLEMYLKTYWEHIEYRGILFSSKIEHKKPKGKKRKTTKARRLEYEKHSNLGFSYVHKACGREYDLGFFLR